MTLSLLFGKRRAIELSETGLIYDSTRQINLVNVEGQLCPAIDQPMSLSTNSKTMAEPGDDDLDEGGERLY
jgi:hypothetical protein